jgi:hypothetical protein
MPELRNLLLIVVGRAIHVVHYVPTGSFANLGLGDAGVRLERALSGRREHGNGTGDRAAGSVQFQVNRVTLFF